jgi:hypothetical protein
MHSLNYILRGLEGGASVSPFNKSGSGGLGCPADANEEVRLAFGGLHLSDMKL